MFFISIVQIKKGGGKKKPFGRKSIQTVISSTKEEEEERGELVEILFTSNWAEARGRNGLSLY